MEQSQSNGGKNMKDKKFAYFQQKILEHLERLEAKELRSIKKSLREAETLVKAGLPIGTIRTWKGKKFIKIAPNKWKPKYDGESRGAKMAIAALKKKAANCTDSKQLMQLVLENRSRFSDESGRPLPFVQELSDYVSELNNKIERGKEMGQQIDKIYARQLKRIKALRKKGYTDEQIDNDHVIKQTKQAMRDLDKPKNQSKRKVRITFNKKKLGAKPAATKERAAEAQITPEEIDKNAAAKKDENEARQNRSEAMRGNQNAKKDGILNEEVTDGGKENNDNAKRAGISDGTQSLRAGRGEGTGGADASGGKVGDNGAQSVFSPDKSGAGFTDANGDVNRGRGRLGKVQAQKIRAQCREILKKPDDKITEADKQILAQYVGAGGTGEDGASNSGVLYEFYTPRSVVSKVWQLVDKYNPRQDKSVIEPSSGIGRFAEGRSEKFTMFELEEDSARIAHILHPDAEIVQGAFQEHFMKQKKGRFTKDFKKFDVAVGNPPYGAYTGKYKGLGEGKDFKRYDSYFMARTLDTLVDGGIMAMVVPSGFLDGKSSYGKDLEKIAGKAKLLEAWRLPNGTFDSTDVGTDIVVFQKGDGGSVEDLKNYFKNNPEHIAGVVSTRTGRFGKAETYVKPKEGESFESAIANIDVGKTETENAVKAAAEAVGVKSETKEASPVTAKTVFGDTVKTKSGTGIVRGYVKKDGKTAGVVVNVNGKREEVLFSDEQAQARSRSEAMKGNQNAKGEHDYPQNPAAHIIDVEEFNKKYGKKVDAQDMPIWKATDKFGNVDMTKLSAEQQKYVEKSPHFVKDGGVYVNAVNYASGNIRQKLRLLDVNDAQYELKKSLLESVCPKEKKIGEFTLSPITDWAREYVMQDGGNLIDGFFAWAYNGYGYFSAGSSPISAEEIPAEISFSDIEAFIEKKPLKLARNEADADDPKLKARYKERKKQLRRDTAITLFNRYLAEGLSLDERAGVIKEVAKTQWIRARYEILPDGKTRGKWNAGYDKRKMPLLKYRNEFCLQNSGGLQSS